LCAFSSAHKAAGAAGARHSLRPHHFERVRRITRTRLRRGNAETCVLRCLTSKSDHQDNGGPSTSSCPRLSRGIHVLLTVAQAEARGWPGQGPAMTKQQRFWRNLAERKRGAKHLLLLTFNMTVDTAAGPSTSSCPRLSRASTSCCRAGGSARMAGTSPAMTKQQRLWRNLAPRNVELPLLLSDVQPDCRDTGGPSTSSCPRLSRASTFYSLSRKPKRVDARDKSGHDDLRNGGAPR
jgi:hypothetical protein